MPSVEPHPRVEVRHRHEVVVAARTPRRRAATPRRARDLGVLAAAVLADERAGCRRTTRAPRPSCCRTSATPCRWSATTGCRRRGPMTGASGTSHTDGSRSVSRSGSKVQCCRTGATMHLRREVGSAADQRGAAWPRSRPAPCPVRPASFSGSWCSVKRTGAGQRRRAGAAARSSQSSCPACGDLAPGAVGLDRRRAASRPLARSSRHCRSSWAVSLWSGGEVATGERQASCPSSVLPARSASCRAAPRRRSTACRAAAGPRTRRPHRDASGSAVGVGLGAVGAEPVTGTSSACGSRRPRVRANAAPRPSRPRRAIAMAGP